VPCFVLCFNLTAVAYVQKLKTWTMNISCLGLRITVGFVDWYYLL